MRQQVNRMAALILGLAISVPAWANDGAWSKETFEYNASIIRQRPMAHARIIEGCSKVAFGLSDEIRTDLERDTGMTADQVSEEVCRRMIRGIASGAVTYEIYKKWWDTPSSERVTIPDYK